MPDPACLLCLVGWLHPFHDSPGAPINEQDAWRWETGGPLASPRHVEVTDRERGEAEEAA